MEDIQINDIIYITEKAGEIIMKIYNENKYNIELKNDQSPVTIADVSSSDYICKELKNLYKDIPIICEETKQIDYNIRRHFKYFWLVDPLDGTKEFIKRNNEFTCNLALIEKNKVTYGFVGIPAKGLVYEGGYGFGSRKHYSDANYESIKCTNQKDVIRVVASKSHLNKETIDFIQNLGKETELIQAGSSLKFIKVAEGNADLYPRMAPTCEWDTAAAHAIVEGAGGRCGCKQGYGNAMTKSTQYFSCAPCNVGKTSFAANQSACHDCAPGRYADQEGQRDCSPCRSGTYFEGRGALTEFQCRDCVRGKYAPTPGFPCIPCPPGAFCPDTGMSSYIMCDVGRYSQFLLQTSCTSCPPGHYQNVTGQAFCRSCKRGTYSTINGANSDVIFFCK